MRYISGIQPTGTGVPHIGNYLGVLKNIPSIMNSESYFFIADIHSTTVDYDVQQMKRSIRASIAMAIACGIPKDIIFQQSSIDEHSVFSTLLSHITPLGLLERMTQFKDKKETSGLLTGLLTYPILMASDILLYDVDKVPVGADQIQHLQLTRDLSEKFNRKFGDILKLPESEVMPFAKVMSLQDGTKKMSKSDKNQNSIIYLNDTMDVVSKKYKKAQTDSEFGIYKNGDKMSPPTENLISILSSMTGDSREIICDNYGDKGYGVLKKALIEAHEKFIYPIREKYENITDEEISTVIEKGNIRARSYAATKLKSIKEAMGLVL